MTFRVLDLFSGIGGFSLGLERTGGFETVAFCEIEPYPRAVLAKHWPGVPIYDDVRTLTADTLRRDGIAVDVICGGFPCQDVSFAGKRAGLEGARSGLWREYARLIGELRPRFVIVENVPGLLNLGMGTVLGDLAALGYGATWDCIPASAVGAPHRRDRVWVIAYSGSQQYKGCCLAQRREEAKGFLASDTDSQSQHAIAKHAEMGCASEPVANACRPRLQKPRAVSSGSDRRQSGRQSSSSNWWAVEPDVGRVASGLSTELDGGGLNDQTEVGSAEGRAKGRAAHGKDVQGVRIDTSLAETSSGLHETNGRRGPLPSLSCEGRSRGRNTQSEAGEGMQGMRQGFHAEPQQETHHMQQKLSFGYWPHERNEALGIWEREPDEPRIAKGVKDRVVRLKGLGNAVVPQIPELIGRAILQAEGMMG